MCLGFSLFFASLKDILSLAQEVHQSTSILQSKSPSYKKSQGTLKSMLQAIFPKGGKKITMFFGF